ARGDLVLHTFARAEAGGRRSGSAGDRAEAVRLTAPLTAHHVRGKSLVIGPRPLRTSGEMEGRAAAQFRSKYSGIELRLFSFRLPILTGIPAIRISSLTHYLPSRRYYWLSITVVNKVGR